MFAKTTCLLLCLTITVAASAQQADTPAKEPQKKTERKGPAARRSPVTLPPPEPAPEPPPATSDPMEVLRRAQSAAKDIKRIYYEGRYTATGDTSDGISLLWGTIVLGERGTESTKKFRVMVPGTVPGPSGFKTAMAGYDGKKYFLVDVNNETVTETTDRAVIKEMDVMLNTIGVKEFLITEPFAELMSAPNVDFVGTDEVIGIPCYVVRVANADESVKTDWYFSTFDALPRRIERTTKHAEGRTVTTKLVLEKMAVNPAFPRDPFATYVPKGYKVVGPVDEQGAEKKDQSSPQGG